MRRPDLIPDCRSCAAICCVATSFDASDDFGFDKAAGVACRYLMRDCRCAIHGRLVERGFRGCASYDCYGAGQRATRAVDGALDGGRLRHEAFRILYVIHELLWLLTEAATLCRASRRSVGAQPARASKARTEAATEAATGTATEAATGTATEAATGTATEAATGAATEAATGAATEAATGAGIDAGIEAAIEAAIDALDAIARGPATALLEIDLRSRETAARALLRQVGHAVGGRRRAAHALVVLR